MTDPYTGTTSVDDIDDALDTLSARLSREADALIRDGEARSFESTASLRQAVRDDVEQARLWARERAERSREGIQEEPLRATAYALGIGLLIGLLLRR